MTMNISKMSAALNDDRSPEEVGDTDQYNRLQLHGAISVRDDLGGEIHLGGACELLRVLIVDDCRDSADVLSMLIDAWGHDVRRAYDGPTGLTLAAAHQPHVVLFDIAMSHMNGVEFLKRLRRQPRVNACLLVALTGYADAKHRLECEEAGIDMYLLKPLDPSILQTLLTWRSLHILRPRQETGTQRALHTTFQQLTDQRSRRPTQSHHQLLQEIEVS